MIISAIVTGFLELLKMIFGVLPTLPAMPSAVTDVSSWFITMTSNVSAILDYLYGHYLYLALIGATILLFQFENIYHLTMWIIRKLPIGIK